MSFLDIRFEFEYDISNYIFDLCLLDRKILVEFDSPYHSASFQREIDESKDKVAEGMGWKVIRIKVPINSIISHELLYPILGYDN